MRRRDLSFTVQRTRRNNDESVRITVRHPSGSNETYDSLEELPNQYRNIVEPLLRAGDLRDLDVQPASQVRRRRRKWVPGSHSEREVELVYYWFDIVAVLGAIILAAFCLWWTSKFFARQSWILLAFSSAGSILSLYWLLAFLVNRTILRADDHGLDIRHRPLYWPGSRFIPIDDIQQLFVSIRPRRRGFIYSLEAVLTWGDVVLVRDIRHPEEARSIEKAIERRLGIKDRPVSGPQYR